MGNGCNDRSTSPKDEHSPLPSLGAGADTGEAFRPRRPARRYFMTKSAEERCEVYSVLGDSVTPRQETHCPPMLDVGERIRLAGKACMREGAPERTGPVMCPADLIYAERDDYFAAKGDGGLPKDGGRAQ